MVRTAILIDGGYLLKRLPDVRPDVDESDAGAVAVAVKQLVGSHLRQLNRTHHAPDPFGLLYRTFYYDARPYRGKTQTPIGNKPIDYSRTPEAQFREDLFKALHGTPNLAVRLGEVRKDPSRSWLLRSASQKRLLRRVISVDDLVDDDFSPAFRQKGVDMRIGLDIASITLKRQADVIVLVSGDADFVPAAKLARREGVKFLLDPLWQNIPPDLHEHIDGLTSGFFRPKSDERHQPKD